MILNTHTLNTIWFYQFLMKTKTIGLFAIPVFAAIMIVAGVSTHLALADPDGSNPNSASISRDAGCSLFDGEGNSVSADGSISIVTHGPTTTLICHADTGVPTPDGKAAVQSGFLCGTYLGITTDTHSTVTPDGLSTLVCRVNNAAQNP